MVLKRNLLNRTRSDFLYQFRPSFLEGFVRVFDIFGTMPVRGCRYHSPEADAKALRGDWETIGEDLRGAMMEFEVENGLDVLAKVEAGYIVPRDSASS